MPDPIAVKTLYWTVAGVGVAIVGAIAALAAAYFGWKAPSKEDLERVERNTADAARHMDAARTHLAGQEERLSLLDLARQVGITVEGSGPIGQPLPLHLTVVGPEDLSIFRLDLINRDELRSGTLEELTAGSEAKAYIGFPSPNMMWDWYNSGANGSTHQIRVHFRVSGQPAQRTITV